jgi:hypothetical protein
MERPYDESGTRKVDRGKSMIVPLATGLYWTGIGLALLFLLSATVGLLFGKGNGRYPAIRVAYGIAVVAWLFSRACWYVLVGR